MVITQLLIHSYLCNGMCVGRKLHQRSFLCSRRLAASRHLAILDCAVVRAGNL
jgi:hypothetical protein